MVVKKDRKGLGRGLSALMADIQPSEGATPAEAAPQGFADRNAPVEQLFPNPDQPRRSFFRGRARGTRGVDP